MFKTYEEQLLELAQQWDPAATAEELTNEGQAAAWGGLV